MPGGKGGKGSSGRNRAATRKSTASVPESKRIANYAKSQAKARKKVAKRDR